MKPTLDVIPNPEVEVICRILEDVYRPSDSNRTLYHYTGLRGLQGIIDSASLYATDIHFLNDSSEVVYAHQLIKNVIESLIGHSDDGVSRLAVDAKKKIEGENFDWLHDVYVVCFCESNDLLSQWRGYGEAGGGFALGFQGVSLKPRSTFKEHEIALAKVEYERGRQEEIVREIVRTAAQKLADSKFEVVLKALIRTLSRLLAVFKLDAFHEESEWRIVIRPDTPSPRFRAGRSLMIPYLEFRPLFNNKLPLTQIRYGKIANEKFAERSLRLYLDAQNYHDVIITQSGVPLRQV